MVVRVVQVVSSLKAPSTVVRPFYFAFQERDIDRVSIPIQPVLRSLQVAPTSLPMECPLQALVRVHLGRNAFAVD